MARKKSLDQTLFPSLDFFLAYVRTFSKFKKFPTFATYSYHIVNFSPCAWYANECDISDVPDSSGKTDLVS